MSKRNKLILSLISVVCVLVVIAGIFACFNSTATVSFPLSEEYCDWMGDIGNDALLRNVAIPGSHDSGTAGMVWLAETQNLSVYEQLRCGVRYFDVRINKKADSYVIFHGPINGGKAEKVFTGVALFLSEHPTETVILDFQHFKGGSEEGVLSFIDKHLGGYVLHNDTGKADGEFICDLTVGEVRGKCLIVWGGDKYLDRDYIFARGDDEGKREGVLQSYYYADYHALPTADYVKEALPFYMGLNEKREQAGLFVLQCQLTDNLFFRGPKFREAQNSYNMSAYIMSLSERKELSSINIVMRDYVNAQKCAEIIALNQAKGNTLFAA